MDEFPAGASVFWFFDYDETHYVLEGEAEFTYSSKAGSVLMTCLTGRSVATADKTPQVCAGAGTCTLLDGAILTKAVTANKKWKFRMGLRGYRAWSCIFSHDNSPTASELFTGYAYLTD